ncbi:MAG: hypothetical protein M1819_005540 [Sarea resinae]|nr:MAG: hypothetical protein M1819_005540 [Sarea resinae]
MSYYDIDAILTDAEKVPCTFEISVPGLGYLDNNSSADIKQNTPLPLPLHLALLLALSPSFLPNSHNTSQPTPLLTLSLPSPLSSRVLNALAASPIAINLRALTPNFYALATRMLDLFDDEDDAMVTTLTATFKARAQLIADHAYNPRRGGGGGVGGGDEGAEFLRGLSEEERGLFRAAFEGARGVREWLATLGRKK